MKQRKGGHGMQTSLRSVVPFVAAALVLTLMAPAVGTAANVQLPRESVDLSPALAADGTFIGARGVNGTVDTSAWRLVSNLAAGEPPRFEPEATASAQTVSSDGTQWVGLGSNSGGTDGAFTNFIVAIAASGDDLYVGGNFTNAAGIANADHVARWDGNAWSALGSNAFHNDGAIPGFVRTIAVSGPNIYVGGDFGNVAGIAAADHIARWDGSNWSALGSQAGDGAVNDVVSAIAVSGTNVFVGGLFTDVAGIPTADHVAVWNGTAWSALGSNSAGTDGALNGWVIALLLNGSSLYVGGNFTNARGIATADYLAVWNGSDWAAVGSNSAGTDGAFNSGVDSLALLGTDLYAGGQFTDAAGNVRADYVARWNGSKWFPLGSNAAGTDGALGHNGYVLSMAVSGSDLYLGGDFTNAAGIATADRLARWDGVNWSAAGSNAAGTDGAIDNGDSYVVAIAGDALYIGGGFQDAAGIATADDLVLAVLPGPWSAIGANAPGSNGAFNLAVQAIAVVGTDLYVGGDFTDAAGLARADYVARWNGSAWSALGSNSAGTNGALGGYVESLAVSGTDLYVGGLFTNAAGNTRADYIARWNGSTWSAIGSNVAGTDGALNSGVYALATSAGTVYVGGDFTDAGGVSNADRAAIWNGSSWSGFGKNAGTPFNGIVSAITVSGGSVYVGGTFTDAGGSATADYVARWNGSSWSGLGSNGAGNGALNGSVNALAVSGSDVYVGGFFTNADGIAAADFLARWDGSTWSALGSNGAGNGILNNEVGALAVVGDSLIVGGGFDNAGGITTADYLARWTGTAWLALGSNGAGNGVLTHAVAELAVADNQLYAGGDFTNADGIPMADYFARYAPLDTFQPDGRIKKGTGALIGNDIYNTDAANQTKSGSAAVGSTIKFTVSIQNDGSAGDVFRVLAAGAAASGYQVKYFSGTTEITSAVVAGTYQTASLVAGSTAAIMVKVKILSGAAGGSSVARLVTITSLATGAHKDAVKFIGKVS